MDHIEGFSSRDSVCSTSSGGRQKVALRFVVMIFDRNLCTFTLKVLTFNYLIDLDYL
jgi:hypothetical protein